VHAIPNAVDKAKIKCSRIFLLSERRNEIREKEEKENKEK
jgi:hypothetical protein